jgi:MYXO-CTERM domain-containing protein
MTQDPVFSENPDLPDVPLVRTATLTYPCQGSGYLVSDGTMLKSQYPGYLTSSTPASLYIETLREAGPPIVDTDNSQTIQAALGPVDYGSMGGVNGNPQSTQSHSGCSVAFPRGDRGMLLLFALALFGARFWIRRRRATP